jgi:hypothetical protein
MTKKRKLLIGVLVGTMALTGVLIGTVSADNERNGSQGDTILARVAEILGIDQADVENAFQQAMEEERAQRQSEMEAAREARIQELIDEGVVTQEQVDEWEAWLESRPDNREAMQEWFESRPDLGDALPFFDGGRGFMPGGRDMMPGAGLRGRMPGGQFKGCPNGDWTPPESQTAA